MVQIKQKSYLLILSILVGMCFLGLSECLGGVAPDQRINLSEDQDFIVTDDAVSGEYVGWIKGYPKFEEVYGAVTFKNLSNSELFKVGDDGLIVIKNNEELRVGSETMSVLVSVPGFGSTEIKVTVNILDSSQCVFVDPDSKEDGNGSRLAPRNKMPQFSSDTTVLFKRGTRLVQPHTVFIKSKKNILIGSYGSGPKPILETGDNVLFRIYLGCENPVVRDLEFQSAESARSNPDPNYKNWADAFVRASSTIGTLRIVHNDIHHTHNGITDNSTGSMNGMPIPLAENSEIKWNYIHDVAQEGIYMQAISGVGEASCNKIERINLLWNYNQKEQISSGDGIQTYNVHTFYARNNFIDKTETGNKFNIIAQYNHSQTKGDEYVEITDNYLVGNAGGTNGGLSGAIIYADFKNGVIARNFFKGVKGNRGISGGRTSSDVIIQYNVFYQLGDSIIDRNANIYNNLFYGCKTATRSSQNDFKNNIIYFTDVDQSAYHRWLSIKADYNLYNYEQANMFGTNHNSLADVQPDFEQHGIVADPMFVDPVNLNFHLQSASVAIDRGVFVGAELDYYKTPVTNTPDIGVAEFSSIPTAVITNENGSDVVVVGNEVCLNASKSHVPSGSQITYSWQMSAVPEGSYLNYDNSVDERYCFSPDLKGAFTIELYVNSSAGLKSGLASITISALEDSSGGETLSSLALTENQDFIVVDNAVEGEDVGQVKVYPKFEELYGSATFVKADNTTTFDISNDGRITVAAPWQLIPGTETFVVTASLPGFLDTEFTVSVNILAAENCVFIDPEVSVNGDGSRQSPKNKIPVMRANTNVLFKRGTTLLAPHMIFINNLENVLIASYGTGPKPILEAGNFSLFRIYNGSSDAVVRDLEFTSVKDARENPDPNYANWANAFVRSSSVKGKLRILYCDIHHSHNGLTDNSTGLKGDGQPIDWSDNSEIKWNYIHDVAQEGVYIQAVSGIGEVSFNKIERVNKLWSYDQRENISSGDGIQSVNVKHFIARNNYIDKSAAGNKFNIIAQYSHDKTDGTELVEISDNYFIGNAGGINGLSGAIIYADFKEGRIERNIFKGVNSNRGVSGGRTSDKTIITNNIFDTLGDAITDARSNVYKNIFYGCERVLVSSTNDFKENIIHFTESGQVSYFRHLPVKADSNIYNMEQANMFGPYTTGLSDVRPDKEGNSTIDEVLVVGDTPDWFKN